MSAPNPELNYWYDKLKVVEPTELPFDRPASKHRGQVGTVRIEGQRASPFLSFADSREASPLMAALALWSTVLNRFSRQADVLVGVHLNSEPGSTSEPLPLHLNFSTSGPHALLDLRGALDAAKQTISEAEMNVVPLAAITKRLGNDALIRIALCWCEKESDQRMNPSSDGLAQYPLALKLWRTPGHPDSSSICGECIYDTACFDESTISRIVDSLQDLLQVCDAHSCEALPLVVGKGEIQQQMSWCSTTPDINLNDEQMMDARILSHAKTNPNGVAVSAPDGELTWKQLAEVSESVASVVPPRGMVGIIIEPSTWTAVASLGVWRAGGGYVPMNPDLPSDRLQYIAETAGLSLILAMKKYATVAHAIPGIKTVLVEELPASKAEQLPGATADGCCYMIFTSGSTGKPKGAILSHRAVLSHVLFCIDDHKITAADVCKQSASFMFDAHVMELWPPLCVGAKVVVLKKDGLKDFEYLQDFLRNEQVSRVWFVPSAVSEYMQNFSLGPSVSCLLIGGEAVPLKLCADLLNHPDHPNLILRNIYGPTECSVMSTTTFGSTMQEIPHGGVAYVPIGKPCAWHDCWVLDQHLQPSVSRQGELCILGDGLGDGYAKLPDVTAKTFVNTPEWLQDWGVASSSKMYRTGDLVKWLPNGNLDFIGRIDFQVKLRGLRIELGEIENVLREVPNVTEVVVRVKFEQLVAWTSGSYELAALKEACKSKLPEYMVPTCWIHMEVWPRGGTGKIDTKALPDLEVQETTCEVVAPETPLEVELCDIFKHVLDIGQDGTISVTQSFFGSGGTSLKAASLMVRLRKTKKAEVSFAEFYSNPSVRALASLLVAKQGQEKQRSLPPVLRSALSSDNSQLASTNQIQMLTIYEMDPSSCSYNCPFILNLRGPLNVHALQQAMQHLCEHHPALRTHLGRDPLGSVVQVVVDSEDFDVPFDYWNGQDMLHFSSVNATSDAQLPKKDCSHDDVIAYLREQGKWQFNVMKGPLVRVVVARTPHRSVEEHLLLINQHHAICDGRSISVLLDALAVAYASAIRGVLKNSMPPSASALQYTDFSVWQKSLAETDIFKEQLKYWRENLVDVPLLQLPTDFQRPLEQTDDGNFISLNIPAAQVANCKAFCGQCGSSLYVGLLSLYAIMLSKFARVNDVPIGTAWHGRDCEEIGTMLGYFVNTLVLRCNTDTQNLKELVARTHKTAMGALSNTLVPYEQALQAAGASNSGVTAFFVFQETLPSLVMKDLDVSFVDTNVRGKSLFEFLLELREQPDGSVSGDFFYRTQLFQRSTAKRFVESYVEAFKCFAEATDEAGLPWIFTESDLKQQAAWSSLTPKGRDLRKEAMMDAQILANARDMPDRVAVSAPDGDLTYQQLAEVSARVAAVLPPRSLVGMIIEPSTWTAAGCLGVWRAGGAYVPMNPDLPTDRLQYIAETAELSMILATQKYSNIAQSLGINTVVLEELDECPGDTEFEGATPEGLCYIIFTSGSTGKPKGAMLSHRAVLSHVAFCISDHQITKDDVCKQSASFMFDAHVMELWPPLLVGAKVVILKKDGLKDFAYLHEFLRTEKVNRVWFVPSAVNEFMQNFSMGPSVTCLMIGGEAVPLKLCADILSHPDHPDLTLRNIYGPTECSVMSTTTSAKSMTDIPSGGTVYMPIGKPVWWHDCWILDQHLQPALSRQGELCILGDGLGDGYLNLPDVTAKTFVQTPEWLHKMDANATPHMYRTGDLVRWLPSGNMDFIGRIDFQVKLNGLRIELGEIESVLRSLTENTEVVVKVWNNQLVAYTSGTSTEEANREACRAKLPPYMVPTAWVHMDEWPRGGTGKIDTKALPEPQKAVELEIVAPANDLEEKILRVYKEVLSFTGDVSVTTDFFALGGSSLKAATILFRTKSLTGGEALVSFSSFHTASSVRQLAGLISAAQAQPQDISQIPEITSQDWIRHEFAPSYDTPASYGQEQMLIFFEMNPSSFAYNVPTILRLRGRSVNVEALRASLQWLGARHDALRMNCDRKTSGEREVYARICSEREFQIPFHYYDGKHVSCLGGPSARVAENFLQARESSGAYIAASPRASPRGSPRVSPVGSPRASSSADLLAGGQRTPEFFPSIGDRFSTPIQDFDNWLDAPVNDMTLTGLDTSSLIESGGEDITLMFEEPEERGGSLKRNGGELLNFDTIFDNEDEWISQDDLWQPRGKPKTSTTKHVIKWLYREAFRPFDLIGEPLIRTILAKPRDTKDYFLLINLHHAITDGKSNEIIAAELAHAYSSFKQSKSPPAELAHRYFAYADYAAWQRKLPESESFQAQVAFWKRELAGLPSLQLPSDVPRGATRGDDGDMVHFSMAPGPVQSMQSLCSEKNTSMFPGLVSIYALILGRYTCSNDVPIGASWAGRDKGEVADMVGYFVNQLILRVQLGGPTETFSQLLGKVQKTILNAWDNALVPYGVALEASKNDGKGISVGITFQEDKWSSQDGGWSLEGLDVTMLPLPEKKTKFDLSLALAPLGSGGLEGDFLFSTELFHKVRIQRMVGHFTKLFCEAVANPLGHVHRLDWMPEEEGNRIESFSAGAPVERNIERIIPELLLAQTQKKGSSKARAVVCHTGRVLTYKELESAVVKVAQLLLDHGTKPSDLVCIFLERSAEQVVAMCGTLFASAAYANVDPEYPPQRVAHILEDIKAPAMITQKMLHEKLTQVLPVGWNAGIGFIFTEDWDSSVFGKDAAPTLDLSTMTPSSLAYSVFSSGSTGKAKGSLIEHRSLVNAVENYIQFMELEAGDRVLQFFNPAFDGGQLDIWTTLCSGATLVCWDSKSDFTGMIKDNEVNKLALSPSALAVVDENLDRNLMQRIVTAAEPIPLALAKTWAARSGLVNLYGPSECTVFCTGGQIPPSVEMVTIGKPTSNVPNYILQHQALTKQPVGVPGELCVGGCQVARGYLERPELTAEKFVPNPFLTGRDDRMYRTGDMVSWTDKGDIVFIGRFDFQVKIRGFRIELGEIEAALQAAGASLSLVIVENEQLVAAVTPELDAQNLKKAIGKTLPPFMVPNKIMTMAEMPMTVNGKIDRDKLRQMLREFGEDETVQFVEPRSPLEIRVAGLVCEVLGLQRISVTDDLKSAGLSSLKAVKLVTKLREAGIQSIFLTELYQCSAVEDIVTLVEQYHRAGSFVIDGDEDALALDTRRTACPVSSTMNSLCFGILTLMAWLWFGAALVLPVLLPAELGRILWKQIGFWEAFAFLGFAGMPLYFFGVAMMVVLTKWIVIGRYREKTRETGSLFFFRWWLVDRLYDVATQTVLGHMRGGPLHYYFLRLLGLKASAYCQIETRDIREWDLVMILGGSIIAEGCSIRPAVLEEGRIHLRWIRIGGNVLIGESSHVLAGAKICDNVTLMPMSLVSGREAELPPFTTWEGAPLRAVEGKTASRSRFGSSANRSLECSPRMSTRQSLNATPRHMRSPEASPRMGAPMSPARRSSYGSPGIGSSVDRTSSVPLLVSHMRFSSDSVMQIRTHNSPWTGLVVLRQLITDIIALGMSGLVLLAGAACAYAILGLLVNAWVKEWDWIQEEKGFFILAIAITYTPLAIPFVDILSGVDYNEAWKSLQNHWEGEDFLLQLVMMVILVIALTSAGLVSALLAVVFTRLGGKVPTNLSASKPQHRVGLFCLRLAWPRYPAQFNGTLGTAVWLRLLGAKVHLTSIITLAEPPSNAGMLEVKRRSVVAGAMLCTSSFERSSSGELKRIKGTVEIGEHCVVAGLLPPGTKVSSYGVVAGLTVSPGVVYKNLAAAGTPAFQAKSPMLPREFVTRRCTDRLTHVLSVLYPLLCPPLLNMIFMLIFVPATVPLDLWEEEIQASGGRGIHIVMICIIPALFLVIGVAFGVCTMLLKWLLSLLDCVSQRGEDGCRWRPMIRPKYYLDLLINTIIGLGMGQFMSFTVGTKVYSLWLYMLGADVHPSALIFTRVADFSRVSVGADAIVCHGAALGTTRMLQVEGGGTAVAHSSVVVAPRSTVGYGSAVTCAETGDLSVSGALTSLPPDLILPPRSLAIGSTPHRFEWHRDNVKQLDQSPAYAPDLMKDVVLPKTFQSNLLKTLRLRTQRLSSTVMEHSTVKCALVTGANGFLGRYITAELLKLEENPEVICFVRGKDEDEAKARLLKSLADAGISEARAFGPKGRVRVVCGDLGKELLGLDREKFHELAETVTHIYHSGARVNHAEPYEHLRRENVWGTAKLLEFSVAQTLKEFHYVSTYSTTTVDMLGPDGLMSEEAPLGNIRTGLLGGSCELTGGYVFSKWTAEQLVILAGEEGAKCAIHRPGMIGGQSVDGKSGDDNFVNFLNDIVRMGMIPRLVGAMFNTTPVDFVAYSIVHASRQPKTDKGVRRFHPIAKDSDLDSRDIYELLNRKGYHIRWCGFPEFRKLAKAQGDGMKSWLLIAGLTGEGHGMDSMADNRNSWEHMRKARGAATWRPQDTLSKMIDYLMSKGKLPLPTARPSGARHRNLSMD